MDPTLTTHEIGKGIADFGFLVVAGASYLAYSATLFFFFIRWFVRLVNGIITTQQRVLDELLQLQKEQLELLESINNQLKKVA